MKQDEALEILKMGYNVYLTGQPGSGKTHLLNRYISFLKRRGVEVGVTASTGIAATHMEGITIHSWAGIGIKDALSDSDLQQLLKKRRLQKRFQQTKVLIIDEVSMLHAHRLDLVDRVTRAFKNSGHPFGGMQVVLCGDFFQLPPVSKAGGPPPLFVNRAKSWNEMGLKVCYLSEQYRQVDSEYLALLGAIRENSVDQKIRGLLQKRYRAKILGSVKPTNLYTHNIDVDRINERELAKIPEKPQRFIMESHGPRSLMVLLKQGCLAPEELVLKPGAVVMFVKNNFNQGYVNGTLGRVLGFEEEGPVVKIRGGEEIVVLPETWSIEEGGRVEAEISQLPLRLAWAITVHKSQGMSLEAAEVDLSRSFEPGMGYVAFSRIRSLSGLRLMGFNQMALEVKQEILMLDQALQTQSDRVRRALVNLPLEQRQRRQEAFLRSIGARSPRKAGPAARTKKRDKERKSKAYSVAKIRESHPRAYEAWTAREEEVLLSRFKAGRPVREIAHVLGRREGSVASRLKKLKEESRV